MTTKTKNAAESNPNSKLNWVKVNKIRNEYRPRTHGFTQQALADKYGVTRPAIAHIISNRRWHDAAYIPPH